MASSGGAAQYWSSLHCSFRCCSSSWWVPPSWAHDGQLRDADECRGRGCKGVRVSGPYALYQHQECGLFSGVGPDLRESNDHPVGQWGDMQQRRSVPDGAGAEERAARDGNRNISVHPEGRRIRFVQLFSRVASWRRRLRRWCSEPRHKPFFRRALGDEGGAVAILVAVAIFAFIGLARSWLT